MVDTTEIENSLNRIADSLEKQQKDYDEIILKLKERIENLEEAIKIVPEFYEYWKGLNACGYND